MRFSVLASGSAGNSAFLATAKTRILIDAGLSVKELAARLAAIGERAEGLDAILITHEHGDHVAGLPRLIKAGMRCGRAIPVYLTRMTAPMIDWQGLECPPVKYFDAGAAFSIGDIGVSSFTCPHDAVDPLTFCFSADGVKVGVATDLGFIPDAMRARFRQCDVVMIESNYDPEMLATCNRPPSVIERIQSRNGHLSNGDVREYIAKDLPANVQHVVLGHISRETNSTLLVATGARETLAHRGLKPKLTLAYQDRATEVIEL